MSYDPAVVATFGPVPAGKVRLCDYGDAPAGSVATRETLAEGEYVNPHGCRFPAVLWFKARGFTPAGSVLRWDDSDTWGVSMTDRNGSTWGNGYRTEAEARAQWARITSAEAETVNA